jgi:dephospho-CoA kinase
MHAAATTPLSAVRLVVLRSPGAAVIFDFLPRSRYKPPVHLFGLTGGIASGKSTVAARLRARGLPVIDADQLARQVVLPGTEAFDEIREEFGVAVLSPDGSIDRKALGALVFSDPARRARLNAITHPRIAVVSAECASQLKLRGEPLACYEAALLVENGLARAFAPLVVVAASEETQVARVMVRDGVTAAEAEARIRAQMPLAAKVKVAAFVIPNDGTLDDLFRQTDATLAALARGLGVPMDRYARSEPSEGD